MKIYVKKLLYLHIMSYC